jgi:phosphatidate cytidylyltransferase
MNENLKLRIRTALIGVPLVLWLLLGLGVPGVAFLAWVISTGMLYEFCRMFLTLPDARAKTWVVISVATLLHALNFVIPTGLPAAILGIVPPLALFLYFLFCVPRVLGYGGLESLNSDEGVRSLSAHVHEFMALTFASVYCVWFPMLMVEIRSAVSGKHWLLFTLLVIWSSDTFAYFAGRFFGRRRLFETVSPKKTWEGAIGGTLGALLVAGTYAAFFLRHESPWFLSAMILTLSAAGIVGDLAESLLKRASKEKDSGSILPGHGGFMDRFDGVVFALPVTYLVLRYLS